MLLAALEALLAALVALLAALENLADPGSGGPKRTGLQPQSFLAGGERGSDPRLPPLTLARGYQDLKILDPRSQTLITLINTKHLQSLTRRYPYAGSRVGGL